MLPGHFVEAFQLGGGFDVEAQNARIQRHAHFRAALAHAGEHHLACIAASRQHALQFAAGNDVETGAQARERIQDRKIGIGLYRVANQMFAPLQGLLELGETVCQRRKRIYIAWRAKPGGNIRQRHLLGMKLVVLIMEIITHGYLFLQKMKR